MRYRKLGEISSVDEIKAITAAFGKAGKDFQAHAFQMANSMRNFEAGGGLDALRAWDGVSGNPACYVYNGRNTTQTEPGVWAAVVVESDDELTLLKASSDYRGGQQAYAELLADAMDRWERGEYVDETE